LQVYAVAGSGGPEPVRTPADPEGQHWNWSRKEIAEWLIDLAESDRKFIAGIDHAFSFPASYFERYHLKDWDQFLNDFCRHWPTDEPYTYVDFVRERNPPRTGSSDEFRLADRRTSSAKSVFRFEGHGCVAKGTHAGIPWMRRMWHCLDGVGSPAGRSTLTPGKAKMITRRLLVGQTLRPQSGHTGLPPSS
jgi:hypothetical protein